MSVTEKRCQHNHLNHQKVYMYEMIIITSDGRETKMGYHLIVTDKLRLPMAVYRNITARSNSAVVDTGIRKELIVQFEELLKELVESPNHTVKNDIPTIKNTLRQLKELNEK